MIGIATVAVVGFILSSTRGGDGGDTGISGGSDTDQADIQALASRSIEVLPAGLWPTLYDDFTAEFRERCDLVAFTDAGVASATSLGDSLQLLEFKEMKELTITGETASGTIVGRYHEVAGSDYDIEAAFAREDGHWKIAPAPDTTGCSAFNQLGS